MKIDNKKNIYGAFALFAFEAIQLIIAILNMIHTIIVYNVNDYSFDFGSMYGFSFWLPRILQLILVVGLGLLLLFDMNKMYIAIAASVNALFQIYLLCRSFYSGDYMDFRLHFMNFLNVLLILSFLMLIAILIIPIFSVNTGMLDLIRKFWFVPIVMQAVRFIVVLMDLYMTFRYSSYILFSLFIEILTVIGIIALIGGFGLLLMHQLEVDQIKPVHAAGFKHANNGTYNPNGTYGQYNQYGNQNGVNGQYNQYGNQNGVDGQYNQYGNQNDAYGQYNPYGDPNGANGQYNQYDNQNGAYDQYSQNTNQNNDQNQ